MKRFAGILALILVVVLSVCLLTRYGGSSQKTDEVPETVDVNSVDDIYFFLSGLKPDEVVATADGIEVTAAEVMRWIVDNCDQLLENSGLEELPWDTVPESGTASFAELLLKDAVDQAVLWRLIETNAKAAGLSVSQEDLDAIQSSLSDMEADLALSNITLDQYLFQFARTRDLHDWICQCELLCDALAEFNFGPDSANPPTEEGIRAALEEYGLYKVKHILLASIDTTTRAPLDEATVAEKKATAEKLLSDLQTSPDPMALFDEYMNTYSEDPGLVSNPNGYEFTANTTVDPAFEAAALALEHGQISGVVEGVSGYHIILRLPLDVNMERDSDAYIIVQIKRLTDKWMEQAEIQTTEAFDKLNAQIIYDRLAVYRQAVADLAASAEEKTPEPAQSQE